MSPDGQYLASSSTDGTIKLWDFESRQPLCDLYKGAGGSSALVAFSAVGKKLIAYEGNEMRVCEVSIESLLKRACHLANRNLKHSEWQRYVSDLPYRLTCTDLPSPEDP